MNKHWIGERVAVIDIDRALKNIMLGSDDFGWGPNNQFKFPLRGGTGEFYKRFDRALDGHIHLSKNASLIDIDRKIVYFTDGTHAPYDVLITALPLDVLCRDLLKSQEHIQPIRDAATKLRHSSGYMVGIGLKSRSPGAGTPDTKSWMYFPEENCPFYRVTYLSNYSPNMTPDKDNYYSLLCEVSESDHKPTPGREGRDENAVIEDCIRGLENAGLLNPGERDNIVSRWCYYADYSYPTPCIDRDDILAEVIPWLEDRDIYSRGRFGMWKYEVANTDHTLMQGVELINRLVLNEPEHTVGMVYRVTDDGRQAASHERSAHAGSGEKKLAGAPMAAQGAAQGKGAPTATLKVVVRTRTIGDQEEADVAEEELGVTQRRA